ncbi:MAG: dihydrolipoyl dehydrogenase family protein [Promethearchaeota archaeon]
MKKYDLVVIGSGVGLNIINPAIQRGLNCAIVEMDKVGGTCLTRGCIPSKILIYPADIIREAQHARYVGIDFVVKKINWDYIAERMWENINESTQMEDSLAHAHGLNFYKGIGEFTGDYQLKVQLNKSTEIFEGEKFVIASGARSFIPPIKGIEEIGYITNESFFGAKFPKKPWKSLILIGGGIIAAEFAHLFSALGTKVTIIEMLSRLCTTEEQEISRFLETNFRRHMTVLLNKKAVEATQKKDLKVITVEDTNTGKRSAVQAEEVFVATGRRSNNDILKVENTGVETDKHGWIKTNEYLETSKENIWCVGDANGIFQFRHTANYEGEICSHNLFADKDNRRAVDYSSVPWAIFTYPQVGHVGMTEAEAIARGHKIYTAKHNYSSVAKGFAMGFVPGAEEDGFVKLIVDQSRQLLGAHIVGSHAAILIQPFVYLMNAGYVCNIAVPGEDESLPTFSRTCPEAGSFMPIYRSQVIHPSLNEVTGWAIGSLRPVNIEHHHHHED